MTPKSSKSRPRRRQRTPEQASPSTSAHSTNLSPEEGQWLQECLLQRIAESAQLCREIENQLRQYPAPELETIIQLYRMLILKFGAQLQATPELLEFVTTLMKPVMDWAHIEEKREDRDFARQKHQEQLLAQQAAENAKSETGKALSNDTLKKIERELTLF